MSDSTPGGGFPTPPNPAQATIPPATTPQETILPGQSESVGVPAAARSGPMPAQFGRYQIEECLGQGAMGSVYKALDTQLDRPVALKIPKFDTNDPGLLERFYREARSAATLSHANICPVFDVGEIDGTHYISMGYIEGKPLSAFIRPDKPLSEKQVVSIVRKLAVALKDAHDKGIVHRDLKPDNVMIAAKSTPVIMDFGLARRETGSDEIRVTQGGQMLGTPAYMSPEQVDGNVELMGPPCDVYSLGVMTYELLTGRLPYEGSVAAVLAQIMKGEPRSPSEFRAGLNLELQAVCLKMMAAGRDQRYATMAEVVRDLTAFAKGTPTSVRDTSAGVTSLGLSEQDAGLSALTAPDDVPVIALTADEPSKVKVATTADRVRQLPTWAIGSGIAAAAVVLFFAVYTLFIKVGDQTIRLTLDDPGADVFIDGDEIRIENLGATIQLSPGQHGFEVKRGDIVVRADNFTVLDGNNPVLKIEVVDDNAATAGSRRLSGSPPPVGDAELRAAVEWMIPYSSELKVARGSQAAVTVRTAADIPDGSFQVVSIVIPRDKAWPQDASEWKHLGSLNSLTAFTVRDPRFNDDMLTYLSGAPRLERLHLTNASVTADGLRVLRTMPALKELTLGSSVSRRSTVVNDDALKSVAEIANLSRLSLEYCSVTDAGLLSLATANRLRELAVSKSPVSEVGVAAFRQAHPDCVATIDGVQLSPGTPTAGPAVMATAAKPRDVIQELAAKSRPKGVGEGVTVFPGANGNGRSGAWCLNVPFKPGEIANGTEWQFTYRTGGSARGLHVIHPWKDGQLVVFLYRDWIAVSPVDEKRDNYLLRSKHPVEQTAAWNEVFPLSNGTPYQVTSHLHPDGRYVLEMNGEIVATSSIDTATPFKLNEKFNDAKAIRVWKPGMAGLLVGPRDSSGINSVTNVKLSGPGQGATAAATTARTPPGSRPGRDKRSPIPPEYANSTDPVRRAVGWAISHQYTVHYRTAKGSGSTSMFKPLENRDSFTVHRVHANQVAGIPQSDWGQIVGFGPALDHVTINHPDFDDAALMQLARLAGLKILALEASAVTETGLGQLADFPALQHVQIGWLSAKKSMSVSETALEQLMAMPRLQTLTLDNCRMTDDSLRKLSESNSLQSLTMRNCDLTDASLEQLRGLQLETLHLQGNDLTDAAGLALSEIKSLKSLTLRKTGVSDETLKLVNTLPNLQMLDLAETAVTSDGFEDVSRLVRLKTLVLDKTSVGDAALKNLVNVEALRMLSLKETDCSAEAVAEFRNARRNCYVGFSAAAR